MTTTRLYFDIDEKRKSIMLKRLTVGSNERSSEHFRLTYSQFYEFLKRVHELEVVELEEQQRMRERERLANLNSERVRSKKVIDILYGEIGMTKLLRNVVGVEVLTNDTTTEDKYNVFIQPTTQNECAIKEITGVTLFSNLRDSKPVRYDFGSIYVFKLSLNRDYRISGVQITRKPLIENEGATVENCVAYAEIIFKSLEGKNLNYLADNYHLLTSIPKEIYDTNEELRNRLEATKNQPLKVNWEGLSV